MKVMIRRDSEGVLSAYVPKKDLEEPIVAVEKPEMWGGSSRSPTAGSSSFPKWRPGTTLPITVEAQEDRRRVT